MLAGVDGEGANEQVIALESACRALEARMASPSDRRDPRDRLGELERSVAELGRQRMDAEAEHGRLVKDIGERFERRRSSVLGRLEAARQGNRLAEAHAAIERASAFFELPFLEKTHAEIERSQPKIRKQLDRVRKELALAIAKTQQSLENHGAVREEARSLAEEQASLKEEIASLEQDLAKVHHIEHAVFDSLHGFSRDQLDAYRNEVVLSRLEDARREKLHGLAQSIWGEDDT
jgi:chromosome segregation ATPase